MTQQHRIYRTGLHRVMLVGWHAIREQLPRREAELIADAVSSQHPGTDRERTVTALMDGSLVLVIRQPGIRPLQTMDERPPATAEEAAPTRLHPLEIELRDRAGAPLAHERYEVHLPSGAVLSGQLDARGFARIDDLGADTCRVDFPDLAEDFALQDAMRLE